VQPESGQSLFHFSPKSFGVSLVTKHRYKVIRETREFREASAGLLETSLEPQVQHVVQVHVREHWADGTALGHPVLSTGDDAMLHHAGFQPFVQESHKSPVIDPMPHEFAKPLVLNGVEVADHVDLNDVPHATLHDSLTE